MAGKQSSALSTHAALRQRVISNMKQNHPDEFIAAERALGMRMSDVEDVVLAGYLDAFSAMASTGGEPAVPVGLDVLRQALLHAGIPVPEGVDLVAWSLSVSRHVSRQSEAPPVVRSAEPAGAAPAAPGGLTGRSVQSEPPRNPVASTQPAATTAQPQPAPSGDDLDDLFAEPGGYDTTPVPAPVTPAQPAAQPQPAPSVDDLDDLFAEPGGYNTTPVPAAVSTAQPAAEPQPVVADDDLDDLFAEPGGYNTTPIPAAVSTAQPVAQPQPAPSDDDLDDLFAEPGGYNTTPVPAPVSSAQPAVVETQPVVADDDLDDLFAEPGGYNTTPVPAAGTPTQPAVQPAAEPQPVVTDDDLDDLFAEPGGYNTTPVPAAVSTAQPVAQPQPAPSDDDLDDLFAEPGGYNTTPVPAPVTPTQPAVQPAAEPQPVVTDDDLDDLFAEPGGYNTTPVPAPVSSAQPAAATWPSQAADRGPASNATLFAEPLRPQLAAPKRRGAGRKRGGRLVAVEPSRDMPAGTSSVASATPAAAESVLAAVAIPRPVFISDLEAVAGGTAAVAAWENDMRALKTRAPVRLIGGKPRHRALGSLVLPHGELASAAQEFTRSWWAACMAEYSGGTLYEIAVLLRRNGDHVTSADFKKSVAVLRLNTPRGLVGLVIVTGKDLEPGSETMNSLSDALEVLLKERLALVGVLSTTADRADEDAITAGVELAGVQRDLPVTTPVVFSRTWEWGDNTSSTMKLLIGG
jgi:hypothetical protein